MDICEILLRMEIISLLGGWFLLSLRMQSQGRNKGHVPGMHSQNTEDLWVREYVNGCSSWPSTAGCPWIWLWLFFLLFKIPCTLKRWKNCYLQFELYFLKLIHFMRDQEWICHHRSLTTDSYLPVCLSACLLSIIYQSILKIN